MTLIRMLEQSSATPAFREAVAAFCRTGHPNERITLLGACPPVKVERTLTKILEEYGELPIERVEIEGRSGCEFFRGKARIVAPGEERLVSFHWDCRWRAIEQGWTDYFGLPDQIRAAREFGYDCFRSWTEETKAYSS